MKIWSWKSATVLWIFSWIWLSAFDSCLPRVVKWSTQRAEYTAAQEALELQEETAKYVFRQKEFEAQQALYYKTLGMPL